MVGAGEPADVGLGAFPGNGTDLNGQRPEDGRWSRVVGLPGFPLRGWCGAGVVVLGGVVQIDAVQELAGDFLAVVEDGFDRGAADEMRQAPIMPPVRWCR